MGWQSISRFFRPILHLPHHGRCLRRKLLRRDKERHAVSVASWVESPCSLLFGEACVVQQQWSRLTIGELLWVGTNVGGAAEGCEHA